MRWEAILGFLEQRNDTIWRTFNNKEYSGCLLDCWIKFYTKGRLKVELIGLAYGLGVTQSDGGECQKSFDLNNYHMISFICAI